MQRSAALAVAALALCAMPAHAGDAEVAYGEAFVGAFAATCVPERLSYPGTIATAEALGWVAAERTAHPELAAMMAKSEAAAAEAAEEMQGSFEQRLYALPIAAVTHYLVVSRSSFVVTDPEDPWVFIGCYLYNFDATAPIDPAPMTALLETPISNSVDQDGLVAHVWGPPCPMPRTGDSYLSFVAEDSPHVAETGFSGLMIKFSTSEPDPGEDVPETYC